MTWSDDYIIRMSQEVAREQFADLHVAGVSAAELTRRTGLHRSAVYRRIERLGRARGVSGPPRRDYCQRGHSMAEHGVEIPKERGGGRYCSECERMRGRTSWKTQR